MKTDEKLETILIEVCNLAKENYGELPLHCSACGATNEDYPCDICNHILNTVPHWQWNLQQKISEVKDV